MTAALAPLATPIIERQLTSLDQARIARRVRHARSVEPRHAEWLADAESMLDTADVVDVRAVGPTVVTMRSRVQLERPDLSRFEVRLCYPDDPSAPAPDGDASRLSVLSPLGLGLIGTRVGDAVEWHGPDGRAHAARVVALPYQPEAAGDYTA